MKEQNQRQIQNQTELDERRLRQKKLVRKRKIVLSVMLLTSFLLGCVCGRYFPEIKLGKTEEVLASAQDNSGEEKKENQITNNVDNGTTADGTEKEEQSATETVEEPADSEETNDPFAEIPQVVLSKPVDYSLNQAIRQLEQMEASDERYAQIVENAEKYPEKLLINLANNPEMIAFVADYKGNTRDYDKAELTEKELQEEYPLFLQWDKRWGCLAYGDDSNVAISGCGPTGGYIIGFLFTALIVGLMTDFLGRKLWVLAVSMVAGLAVCYLFGTIWFMIAMHTDFVAALLTCVVPFLLADAAKIVVATVLVNRLDKIVKL